MKISESTPGWRPDGPRPMSVTKRLLVVDDARWRNVPANVKQIDCVEALVLRRRVRDARRK